MSLGSEHSIVPTDKPPVYAEHGVVEGKNRDEEKEGEKERDWSAEEEDVDEKDSENVEEPDEPTRPIPTQSRWRRLLTIISALVLVWVLLTLLTATNGKRPPKIVHANRYSDEHKFRPAASPIITEHLKDGRVRLRGAHPTASSTAVPKPTRKTNSKRSKRSRKSKRTR
ncbi:hypothetical protein EW145_g4866 [Phellinidium pouzarii]|uniref:Uncharacterized protein n=1 Tax=Phellinidium pouzarii TaxID=167371 RepID=A0A4S4L1Z1_9AGAM|nr:hypothetical protein EW145_g4866 [Phellinidium pouzarii]